MSNARSLVNRSTDYVSIRDKGARGDGITNDTTAYVAAMATGKRIYFPNGTYILDQIVVNDGTHLEGETKEGTVLKFTNSTTKGIISPNFGVRADGATASYNMNITIKNLSIDINNMANTDTTYGIAIEDGWGHLIDNVNVLDSLDELSYRWGLVIGRSTYTSQVSNCTIGRNAILGSSVNLNYTTTIIYTRLSTWHNKLKAAQNILFVGATVQKDAHKFECSDSTSFLSIIGGDMESGGAYIYSDGSTVGVFSAGNAFGGFTGTLFLGSAVNPQTGTFRPGASVFLDEHHQRAGSQVVSSAVTRSTTTATVQAPTTMVGSTYKYGIPMVGEWVQIYNSVAPFNVAYTQVLTCDFANNRFTYAVANSGASSGTCNFLIDNSRGGRYSELFGGAMFHDPLASRLMLYNRMTMGNNLTFGGMNTDGTTEVPLLRLNSANQLELGDGTTNRWILFGANLRSLMPGAGVTFLSPDGLTTKTLTINNSGVAVWT